MWPYQFNLLIVSYQVYLLIFDVLMFRKARKNLDLGAQAGVSQGIISLAIWIRLGSDFFAINELKNKS